MRPGPTPSVSWLHAAAGAIVALAAAELFGAGLASVLGAAAGGFVAARLAGHHGLFQGAAAAAGFVVSAAILDTFSPVPLLPGDTVVLVVLDTLHLAAGAAGGWLAVRS